MVFTMAFQTAGSPHSSQIFKAQFSPVVGKNDSFIKVDEVGDRSDAMGIMACGAGSPLLNNVLTVFGKTLIAQKRASVVTFITERIRLSIFRG